MGLERDYRPAKSLLLNTLILARLRSRKRSFKVSVEWQSLDGSMAALEFDATTARAAIIAPNPSTVVDI